MGRSSRGKGKKLSVSHEDPGSGEEEKNPAQKRRGRPQKPPKDEIDEEEIEKLEEDYNEDKAPSKVTNGANVAENGTKRRRSSQTKETHSPVKEKNGVSAKSDADGSTKSTGFRHVGRRRKSKPRRAAEVGVECN